MAIDWTTLDYTNPALLLSKLEPAYYALIAGDATVEIEGHDRRRVRFQAGDATALFRVINQLKQQVDRAAGAPRRRYALQGRSHGPGRRFY